MRIKEVIGHYFLKEMSRELSGIHKNRKCNKLKDQRSQVGYHKFEYQQLLIKGRSSDCKKTCI